jgi:hypothetical protein
VLFASVLRKTVLSLAIALASCTGPQPAGTVVPGLPPGPSDAPPQPARLADHGASPAARTGDPEPATPTPQAPRVEERVLAGIPITAVAFDSPSHRLVVADQPAGPGSIWPDAAAAARSRGGVAAVNGGFFTPEGAPLGLVIAGGKRAGRPNRASSLGAGLFVDDGSPALVRRDSGRSGAELLQSGPFLVENGRALPGLSPDSSTARTFIGWDGRSGWFIARSGACSLAGLAKALEGAEIGGVTVRSVLNLDGGRSSELWAGAALPGGPLGQRPFWNKPVRNFLVLLPR